MIFLVFSFHCFHIISIAHPFMVQLPGKLGGRIIFAYPDISDAELQLKIAGYFK